MRFFLCLGFGIWLVASALFRFVGHYFFILEQPLLMIATYILAIPIVWVATIPIYSLKKTKDTERLVAAVCIVLPGMLIDAVVLLVFNNVFPNLSADLDRYFASWLLWAYSLILITGFTKTTFMRKKTIPSTN